MYDELIQCLCEAYYMRSCMKNPELLKQRMHEVWKDDPEMLKQIRRFYDKKI